MEADPKRKEAAFFWVSKFYSEFVELPGVKPEEYWKNHILSLAYLCKTQVASTSQSQAESALQAYEQAKEILRELDENIQMRRWKELDPVAAAKGDTTAIYKFILLVLHYVSSLVEEYIIEAEAVLKQQGLCDEFTSLLRDVNSDTKEWWQGSSVDVLSETVESNSSKNNSFSKYTPADFPSTPRNHFFRKENTPLSPIQNAVASPITQRIKAVWLKKNYEERIAELEHQNDLFRLDVDSLRSDVERHKENAREWREKFELTERVTKEVESERDELSSKLDKQRLDTEKAILQGRDYKLKAEKDATELEQLRRERVKMTEDREAACNIRAELERQLRDISEENRSLIKEKRTLEIKISNLQKQVEMAENQLNQKLNETETLKAEQRKILKEKKEEYEELVLRENELRIDLQQCRLKNDEFSTKLQEIQSEFNQKKLEFHHQLNEDREEFNRHRDQLENGNRELRSQCEQFAEILNEKDEQIRKFQAQKVDELENLTKLSTEKGRMQKELQEALNQNHKLKVENIKLQTDLDEIATEQAGLEEELERTIADLELAEIRVIQLQEQIQLLEEKKKAEAEETKKAAAIPEEEELALQKEEVELEPVEENNCADPNYSNVEQQSDREDFGHLDLSDDDCDIECVMTAKSIWGGEWNIQPKVEQELAIKVKEERQEELKKEQEKVLSPIQPKVLEKQVSFDTRSTKSDKKGGHSFEETPQRSRFKIPLLPSPAPSRSSLASFYSEDKENSSFTRPKDTTSERKKKNRRASLAKFGDLLKFNKSGSKN